VLGAIFRWRVRDGKTGEDSSHFPEVFGDLVLGFCGPLSDEVFDGPYDRRAAFIVGKPSIRVFETPGFEYAITEGRRVDVPTTCQYVMGTRGS
jgi:hypothetical protein